MGDPGRFTVDSDELDEVVADVAGCEQALEGLTNDLEVQVRALHEVWEGLAAEAQREAHHEWEQGMRAMRDALAGLRGAARTAHGNYTAAVETNLWMWGQVR